MLKRKLKLKQILEIGKSEFSITLIEKVTFPVLIQVRRNIVNILDEVERKVLWNIIEEVGTVLETENVIP